MFTRVDKSMAERVLHQGTIIARFDQLVDIFGEPLLEKDSEQNLDAFWVIKFDDGTIATIYKWECIKSLNNEHYWHVGGYDTRSIEFIKKILSDLKRSDQQ